MCSHQPDHMDQPDPKLLQTHARQKTTLTVLALVLIAGGLLLLFVLQRLPLPLRIVMGLGDLVAGIVLLVMARQGSAGPKP